jgi:hypothetical protein
MDARETARDAHRSRAAHGPVCPTIRSKPGRQSEHGVRSARCGSQVGSAAGSGLAFLGTAALWWLYLDSLPRLAP